MDDVTNWQPGAEVTAELFTQWRSPRRGETHAQQLTNPVWQWLVRTGANAYRANKHFGGPSPFSAGPGWCCDRFGQSETSLPDGRTILVAGEHEDYYDPDFYIYNDVIVVQPDKTIDIYGYPEQDFPPTDFHSASLIGGRLILIGNLGYAKSRQTGHTPVYVLDVETLQIDRIHTSGEHPGWIFDHNASIDGNDLIIRGGELFDSEDRCRENIDDWKLNFDSWRWTRLTDRRWVRAEISRNDKKSISFSDARDIHEREDWGFYELLPASAQRSFEGDLAVITEKLGVPPDTDVLNNLYHPPIEHEPIPQDEDEYSTFRIRVAGVVVRYVEDGTTITMTIEGKLPEATVDLLVGDLQRKFNQFENIESECRVF